MARYQSKYKRKLLRWRKSLRNHRQRFEKMGAWDGTNRITRTQWEARLKEFDYHCAYCLVQFEEENLWLEHIVGVAAGGTHTLDNIVGACQLCNQQKGDKTLEDFQGITPEQLFARMKDFLDERAKTNLPPADC